MQSASMIERDQPKKSLVPPLPSFLGKHGKINGASYGNEQVLAHPFSLVRWERGNAFRILQKDYPYFVLALILLRFPTVHDDGFGKGSPKPVVDARIRVSFLCREKYFVRTNS